MFYVVKQHLIRILQALVFLKLTTIKTKSL